MASKLPPNVPPGGPNKPGASGPDFSMGIFASVPSSGGSAAGSSPAPVPPPPNVMQPPSPNEGIKGAQGFTTHIPQLRNTFATPPDNADHSDYYASLNPKPPMKSSTKGILVAILVLCAFFGWRAWKGGHALEAWGNSWEKGVDQSEAQKKPQLVLFTADWCPACEDFESKVLSRPEVTSRLQQHFVLTVVDLSERSGPNNQIAASFGVKVIPTMVIVEPDGSRSDYLTGSVPEARLYEWINNRKMSKPR